MVFGLWESIVADADMEVKDDLHGFSVWFLSSRCLESPEISLISDLEFLELSKIKLRTLRNKASAVIEANRGHMDGKFTATILTPISN